MEILIPYKHPIMLHKSPGGQTLELFYLLFYNLYPLAIYLGSTLGANFDILEDKDFKRRDKYCQR